MEIRTHADYAATPEEVFAVVSDPAFVQDKVERVSVKQHLAEVRQVGDTTVISTTRTLPTSDLPDVAKKFVGEVLTLVEEQTWSPSAADGSREARIQLRVDGAPVSLKGTIRLSPKGSGSTQDVVAELTAKVPLMGSVIEKAAAPGIKAGIDAEVDLVKEWLAR